MESMELDVVHRVSWNSMELHGSMECQRFSMEFLQTPWISHRIPCIPWCSLHGIRMEHHGSTRIPWHPSNSLVSKEFHSIQCIPWHPSKSKASLCKTCNSMESIKLHNSSNLMQSMHAMDSIEFQGINGYSPTAHPTTSLYPISCLPN